MNSKRSQLETLNTGRQRRSGNALEEINRTLDNLAERLESALESRESAVQTEALSAQGSSDPRPVRPSVEHTPQATLDRIAGEIEALRQRGGESVSVDRFSEELSALRQDVHTMVSTGVRQEIGALREEMAHLMANMPKTSVGPELSAEFDRLSDAISRLAGRGDDNSAKVLRLELEQVKSALTDLLREEAGQRTGAEKVGADPAMDRLHTRLEEISAAIGKLPDIQSLRTLEKRFGKLTESLEQFAGNHTPGQADLHTLIEERLDEISRAITASTAVARSSNFDPAPLERVEARITSLASQIDELVQEQNGSVITERLNTLSDRVDEIAQHVGVPEELVKHLTSQIAEISKKLDSDPRKSEPALLNALENRFSELFAHLEKRQDETFHQEQSRFDALQARLGGVLERLEPARGETAEPAVIEALDKRFGELAERIETLRQATQDSPELQALQARLDDIATRLQEQPAPAAGIDPTIIQNLEAQVGALANQLAGSESEAATGNAVAPRLENIERSISTYHAEMLEAARQAAEQAVQKRSANAQIRDDDRLADELQKLEALTRKSGERNARTFEAVHDTLVKIVERLGELDAGGGEASGEKISVASTPSIDPAQGLSEDESEAFEEEFNQRSPAEAAAAAADAALREDSETGPERQKDAMLGGLSKALSSQHEPDPEPDEMLAEETEDEDSAPEPEIDPERINEPLEPGSGAPDLNAILRRVRDEGDEAEESSTDTAQSDFVAAARRAAKAAAAEAEISKQNRSAGAEKGRNSGLGRIFKRRKKTLLMLVGTAILAGSGVYLGKSILQDYRQTAAVSETSDPEEAQAGATGAEPTVQAEPAAAGKDNMSTGTIPEQQPAAVRNVGKPVDPQTSASAMSEQGSTSVSASKTQAAIPAAMLRQGDAAEKQIEPVTAIPPIPQEIGPDALRDAAAGGEPQALFEIARRYANGLGVEKDSAAAAEWYRLSAQRGLAPAQYRLGNIYEEGIGIDRDLAEAKRWYLKAAKHGNASAMHNLGVLFAVGAEGKADNQSAARWFLKAAEVGVPDSQVNMGILSAKGVGVPRDMTEAYKWFVIAAESGDKDAATKRDDIAAVLSEEDLEKAKAKAELWQAREANVQANIVDIPDAWKLDQQSTASVDMKQAIANVQMILNKLGFDAGPADGIMGERTRAAIKAFQEKNSLPATGEVDDALVRALLKKGVSAG